MNANWQKNDLGAWVLKLGTLEKAIIIVYSRSIVLSLNGGVVQGSGKWRISPSSYLPFTKEQYNKEFTEPIDCALYSESIILQWLKSLVEGQKEITNPSQQRIDG